MAKPETPRSASTRAQADALFTYLLTLAVQANEQMAHLSLLMDTRSSLEPRLEPPAGKDILEIASPEVQRAVLKQALSDEMRRELKALSLTVEALYDCTDKVTGLAA